MGLPHQQLTLQAYLDWENIQTERHEFYRGEIFAMTGGRRSHGCVTANLVRHLGNQLAEASCRVFSEFMKIQIADDSLPRCFCHLRPAGFADGHDISCADAGYRSAVILHASL